MSVSSTQNVGSQSKLVEGMGKLAKNATSHPILSSIFLGPIGLMASQIADNKINGKASDDGVDSESKGAFEKMAEGMKNHPILSTLLLGPFSLLGANLIDNAANKKHEENGEVQTQEQDNNVEYEA